MKFFTRLFTLMLIALSIPLVGAVTAQGSQTDTCSIPASAYTNVMNTKLAYQIAIGTSDEAQAQEMLEQSQALVTQSGCEENVVNIYSQGLDTQCNQLVLGLFAQHKYHITQENVVNAETLANMINSIIQTSSCDVLSLEEQTTPEVLQEDIQSQQNISFISTVIPRNENICEIESPQSFSQTVESITNLQVIQELIQEAKQQSNTNSNNDAAASPLQNSNFSFGGGPEEGFATFGDELTFDGEQPNSKEVNQVNENSIRRFVGATLNNIRLSLQQINGGSYKNEVLPSQTEQVIALLNDIFTTDGFQGLYNRFTLTPEDIELYKQELFLADIDRTQYFRNIPVQDIRAGITRNPTDTYKQYHELSDNIQIITVGSDQQSQNLVRDETTKEFTATTQEGQTDPLVITVPTVLGALNIHVVHINGVRDEDNNRFVPYRVVLNAILNNKQIAAIDGRFTQDGDIQFDMYSKPYIFTFMIQQEEIDTNDLDLIEYSDGDALRVTNVMVDMYGPGTCDMSVIFETNKIITTQGEEVGNTRNLETQIGKKDPITQEFITVGLGNFVNYNTMVDELVAHRQENPDALVAENTDEHVSIELFDNNQSLRANIVPYMDQRENYWEAQFVPEGTTTDFIQEIIDDIITEYNLNTSNLQFTRNTMRKVFGGEDNEGRGDSAIEGCTDPRASNYKRDATVDDGSCEVSSGGGGGGGETNPQCTITVNAYEGTTKTEFSFSVKAQGEYDTVKLDFGDRTEQQEVTRSVVSKTYRQEGVYTVNAILSIDSGGPASLSAGGTVARCTLKGTITINGTEGGDGTGTSTADDTRTCENKATNYPKCNACEDGFAYEKDQCVEEPTQPPQEPQDVYGCTDSESLAYDPDANVDDGSCTCNNNATNYPNCNACEDGFEYENDQCVEEPTQPPQAGGNDR